MSKASNIGISIRKLVKIYGVMHIILEMLTIMVSGWWDYSLFELSVV